MSIARKNLAALLVLPFLFLGCSKEEQKQEKVIEAKPVEIIHIERKNFPVWADFVGKTQASKSVDVIARVKGRLEKMHFTPGSMVQKGDLLFEIEKADYVAELERQKAKLAQDEASLQLARNDVSRYKPLVEKDLATKEKLDQLLSKQKEVEAMVMADKAAIKQAQLNLSYTDVRARVDGKIGRNLIDEGNMVGTSGENSILANIVKADPMYIYFHPSNFDVQLMSKYRSSEYMDVRVYQPDVQLGGEYRYYKGKIDFIDNTTNVKTGTVTMRANVTNPDYSLFPGSFVNIEVFITDQIPVFAIPPFVVKENQLGSYVFVVDKDNKAREQQIKSYFSNKDMVIVEEGLNEGDKVIVSGTQTLKGGDLVQATLTKKQLITTPDRF